MIFDDDCVVYGNDDCVDGGDSGDNGGVMVKCWCGCVW